jgi:hypothetical protein
VVDSIVSHRGDIERRKHLQFLTLYSDESLVWNPMNTDLTLTIAFENYCESQPALRRLLMTKKLEGKYIRDITKTPIDKLEAYKVFGSSQANISAVRIGPGVSAYVDLRTWSDPSLTWYYKIGLPDPDRTLYLVAMHYLNWASDSHLSISVEWPIFQSTSSGHSTVDSYWVFCYGSRLSVPDKAVLVDKAFVKQYPKVLK